MGLLALRATVFADASWADLLGVVCLVVCAVFVFRLSAIG